MKPHPQATRPAVASVGSAARATAAGLPGLAGPAGLRTRVAMGFLSLMSLMVIAATLSTLAFSAHAQQVTGSTTLSTVQGRLFAGPTGASAQGGSALGAVLPSGGSAGQGFGCQVGVWGVQNGVVKCVTPESTASPSIPSFAGKTLYVRATLIDGFTSGNLIRLTGSATDIRVDSLDLYGALVKSCYLTATSPPCNLGVPGGANTGLADDPRYPAASAALNGQLTASLHTAAELVSGNLQLAANRTGGQLQDNYIVTVSMDVTGVTFSAAGLYFLSGSPNGALYPVYSSGSLSISQLGSFGTNDHWTMPIGNPAPT